MTNKIQRFLSLALGLVMVLSVVSINASADTYTKGSTYRSNVANITLPELGDGLVWSEPTESQELTCGLEEHTHGANCKVEATTTNPGYNNYAYTTTEYWTKNFYGQWEKVTWQKYNRYVHEHDPFGMKEGTGPLENHYKVIIFYKYTDCTAHTHSASCYTTWYTWTVVEAAPTPTVAPTATVVPTATVEPTATVAPTATPVVPTHTPAVPTHTPVVPTATPIVPTTADIPATGDSTALIAAVVAAMILMSAAVVLVVKRKREN